MEGGVEGAERVRCGEGAVRRGCGAERCLLAPLYPHEALFGGAAAGQLAVLLAAQVGGDHLVPGHAHLGSATAQHRRLRPASRPHPP